MLAIMAAFSAIRPAVAGDLLPIIACDSLVTAGPTAFDFFIWTHGLGEFCRVELRPRVGVTVPAEAIVSWEMPEGWSAQWLPNEPGAIEIIGCTSHFSPEMRIVLANPNGGIEAQCFNSSGARVTMWTGAFQCAPATVPALPATWGGMKASYR